MSNRRRRGFTFIEILVAMLFMGILSAIAIPRYRGYKERAYLATMRSDLGHMRIAEEEYFAEHLVYVTDTAALDFRTTSTVRVALSATDPIAGYRAVATHLLLPGQQCATSVGKDAVGVASGMIVCGPVPTGSGTLGGGGGQVP